MKNVNANPVVFVFLGIGILMLAYDILFNSNHALKIIFSFSVLCWIFAKGVGTIRSPIWTYNDSGFQRSRGLKEPRFYKWKEVTKVGYSNVNGLIAIYANDGSQVLFCSWATADFERVLNDVILLVQKNKPDVEIPSQIIKRLGKT